ncbi:hypothetical protein ACHAXA_011799, partial [Cyclostephanos tholiformis]
LFCDYRRSPRSSNQRPHYCSLDGSFFFHPKSAAGDDDPLSWGDVARSCCVHSPKDWVRIAANFAGILFFLYWFIFSLELLSTGAKALTGCAAGGLFGSNTNPVASLIVGMLVTVLLQSSSTTTSIIVSLVGAGSLSVEPAIFMVMGANIGTSVTNTIVAIGQMGNGDELERAFAGATVHDCFNFLSVLILFPIECATKMLARMTQAMTRNYMAKEGEKMIISNSNVIKEVSAGKTCAEYYPTQCDPAGTHTYQACVKDGRVGLITCSKHTGECPLYFLEGANQSDDVTSGGISLLLGIIFLVICLGGLVKVLKSMLLGGSERIIKKATAINGYISMAIGCGITMAVQSSSVTTSVLTPIVGVGIVSVEQMYPLTLGANIGTTITSILAALVAETSSAMQVALAHFFFNIFGIIIWYPNVDSIYRPKQIPFMRAVPIMMCKALGKATRWWRGFPFLYIAVVFFLIPLLLLGLSSLFVSDSKALVTLGSLLLFLWWWFKRDGRAITEANFKRRQYKKDIMTRIIDEWDPLVAMVKGTKSEIGHDLEDGGDLQKQVDYVPESTFHEEEDPSLSTFVGHVSKK